LSFVVLSLVLLERAFRRDATAYVYAAALGLIVALTDFNLTYLSDSTEIGLAIEGAILLGVGLVADRLRRRIGGSRTPDPSHGAGRDATAPEPAPDGPTVDPSGSAPARAAGPIREPLSAEAEPDP
jgi:hypothetical protein